MDTTRQPWPQPVPGFSCIRMKDEAQARIRRETAGMTAEQELEYWRAKEVEFRNQREADADDAARKAS